MIAFLSASFLLPVLHFLCCLRSLGILTGELKRLVFRWPEAWGMTYLDENQVLLACLEDIMSHQDWPGSSALSSISLFLQ